MGARKLQRRHDPPAAALKNLDPGIQAGDPPGQVPGPVPGSVVHNQHLHVTEGLVPNGRQRQPQGASGIPGGKKNRYRGGHRPAGPSPPASTAVSSMATG